MTDERVFNYRRGPSLLHKVRVIMGSNINPIQYGVAIPKEIAFKFMDCSLVIHTSGNSIILESGCRTFATEKNKQSQQDEQWQKYYGSQILQ